MKEKLNVSELIKTGVILFLITALSAALLAVVNSFTAPMIAKNNTEKKNSAMRAVMPDAADFGNCDITPEIAVLENSDKITEIKTALDADGKVIGVCVITETSGYDVGIVTVTGVDKELKVTGVEITSMKETPGLGANAQNEDFRSRYIGKTAGITVSKTAGEENSIQAISGATKTSRGVTEGVNLALEASAIVMEGCGE